MDLLIFQIISFSKYVNICKNPLKLMRKTILLLLFFNFNFSFAQTQWKSPKYGYSIEIPKDFIKKSNVIGKNVNFKAENGKSSIVIVVTTVSKEFAKYSILEMLGDLDSYAQEWESGAKEYLNNPKVVKYGKTTLNRLPTFWLDYTTLNDNLYSKNYSIKKGNLIYTITLTNPKELNSYYSSIWYRFKNSISL